MRSISSTGRSKRLSPPGPVTSARSAGRISRRSADGPCWSARPVSLRAPPVHRPHTGPVLRGSRGVAGAGPRPLFTAPAPSRILSSPTASAPPHGPARRRDRRHDPRSATLHQGPLPGAVRRPAAMSDASSVRVQLPGRGLTAAENPGNRLGGCRRVSLSGCGFGGRRAARRAFARGSSGRWQGRCRVVVPAQRSRARPALPTKPAVRVVVVAG